VDLVAYLSTEDFQRWGRENRQDILSRVRENGVVWTGDRVIGRSGGKVTGCRYLHRDSPISSCEIYETRPMVCRGFVPGSSLLCPQYKDGE
jgi:Fe-S-cluster containining protein